MNVAHRSGLRASPGSATYTAPSAPTLRCEAANGAGPHGTQRCWSSDRNTPASWFSAYHVPSGAIAMLSM